MEKLFEINRLKCSYDRVYQEGTSKIVLKINHLIIPRGKKIFIVGESGIGKSTILETIGLMNKTFVTEEESKFLFYDNNNPIDLASLWDPKNDKQLSAFRLKHYSFIFQSTNLMRNFTAYENICFTRMLQGFSQESCSEKANQLVRDLGLERFKDRLAKHLSGGQQQRVAFARAILPNFTVLFGDEPTGNLDPGNAVKVMQILSNKLDEQENASAIIVSHDMNLAVRFADVIIKIRKEENSKLQEEDEDSAYGVIDDECIFTSSPDFEIWTNGKNSFTSSEFVSYLRKK